MFSSSTQIINSISKLKNGSAPSNVSTKKDIQDSVATEEVVEEIPLYHEIRGVDKKKPTDLTKFSQSLAEQKEAINLGNPADLLKRLQNLTGGGTIRNLFQSGFPAISNLIGVDEQSNNQNRATRVLSEVEEVLLIDKGQKSEKDDTVIKLDGCYLNAIQVNGEEDLVVRSKSVQACQALCQKNKSCEYCTYVSDQELCYHYSSISTLKSSKIAITAPKYCSEEDRKDKNDSENNDAITNKDRSAMTNESDPSGELRSFKQAEGIKLLDIGLFRNLLSGSGLGGLLSGGGSALNIGQTIQAASNILTTSSQLMNALPLKELSALTTMHGHRKVNIGGGGKKNSTAVRTAPPKGLASPTVICHSEGMTCCIPRINDWQRRHPFLNNHEDIESCRVVYVSNSDNLCVTSVYYGKSDKERCGVMVRETDDLVLYRNKLIVPQKGINNALCECIIKKNETEETTEGNARWEYKITTDAPKKESPEGDEADVPKSIKPLQFAKLLANLTNNSNTNRNENSLTDIVDIIQRISGESKK